MNSWRDVLSGIRMLASAGVYVILIVTFGFQAARVDGFSAEEVHHRTGQRSVVAALGRPDLLMN